ncbi:hypothetical protein KSS87_022637 [Heliosperma pusillum]|nr:hypothetical protein KSS87_022637 [Heliosperma pusillum]
MEDNHNDDDLWGNVLRPSSVKTFKSTLSGRSTPRGSPTLKRLSSGRTPRRDGRSTAAKFTWFRSNRLVYWLLLITLWTYGGFYIQSRWAHGENKGNGAGFGIDQQKVNVGSEENTRRELISDEILIDVKKRNGSKFDSSLNLSMAERSNDILPPRVGVPKKRMSRKERRGLRGKALERKKVTDKDAIRGAEAEEEEIRMTNSTFRLLVGPFGSTEDRILEWNREKRSGTCDRNELFARLVWSRNFVLVFHELSMTGAPLSMLELATELLSCGATVHAVILNRRGGLMAELTRRRIKIIDDKAEHSFKAAMKADLVIAGSAVCAQWIEHYLAFYSAGSNQIAWWIMENREEYFDRSKHMLNRVKMIAFLSEMQSKQWLNWSKENNITLTTQTAVIPLSVNDELAFVAGISCSLNTPLANPERMLQRRQVLRDAVRQEMGLTDDDMLVISLGSINAAKGQLLLVESANSVIEEKPSQTKIRLKPLLEAGLNATSLAGKFHLRGSPQKLKNYLQLYRDNSDQEIPAHALKILIGSVGSKSNKVMYVKEILDFLSKHPNVSNSVLWSPTTTHVASLYSAADVYVTNSQGLGETFGRVTIEAMAFGLPVLGTDAGGTTEIVEKNITGRLHPLGRPGTKVLAENLRYLLKNPSIRQQMGLKGREKVERMYLKRHMYKLFFELLFKCMRVK